MVPTDERPQLGALLVKKANEGVRVLILQCEPPEHPVARYIEYECYDEVFSARETHLLPFLCVTGDDRTSIKGAYVFSCIQTTVR